MSLPSNKYKKPLLDIKKQLMSEIASYFDEDGKFEMNKPTVINIPIKFGGVFPAKFKTIIGGKRTFRLMGDDAPIPVINFDIREDNNVEQEVPFLITLLDYISMDNKNKLNNYAD